LVLIICLFECGWHVLDGLIDFEAVLLIDRVPLLLEVLHHDCLRGQRVVILLLLIVLALDFPLEMLKPLLPHLLLPGETVLSLGQCLSYVLLQLLGKLRVLLILLNGEVYHRVYRVPQSLLFELLVLDYAELQDRCAAAATA